MPFRHFQLEVAALQHRKNACVHVCEREDGCKSQNLRLQEEYDCPKDSV